MITENSKKKKMLFPNFNFFKKNTANVEFNILYLLTLMESKFYM